MQLVCACGYVCCFVVLLICGCIFCTLIFKIGRVHTCIPDVCICVWEGGGCGVGWGGVVIGCVSERKMYGCACVLIAIFLMCLN